MRESYLDTYLSLHDKELAFSVVVVMIDSLPTSQASEKIAHQGN